MDNDAIRKMLANQAASGSRIAAYALGNPNLAPEMKPAPPPAEERPMTFKEYRAMLAKENANV